MVTSPVASSLLSDGLLVSVSVVERRAPHEVQKRAVLSSATVVHDGHSTL